MFGGGGFGQQNNNTGGGLFGGGGGGFGQQQNNNATGFGQTNNAFGQPAQQPQQNQGGLFGGGATNTANTGFGFGGNNAPQQNNAFGGAATAARPTFGATGTSTFGATNTGGGMFGGNTQQQQTNTFGAPAANNTGGMFGARPAATTGFGSGATSGLFGARPNTFGTASTPANQIQPYNGGPQWPPVPTTGSSNPQYQPTWQQDPPTSGAGPSTAPPHLFHSISAMEPYRGASWEELRLMDYQQNRKDAGVAGANATATTGGFGQPAAGGFGAQPAPGGFGQPAAPATGFGQPPANNAFGAKPGGLFGGATGATGGFGATNTGGGGMFGAQPQAQPAQNTFGAPNTGATGGGLFGNNQQQQPQTGATGGLFGSSSPFGGANNQQQQQQQPANTGFTFGAPKPAFGAAAPATGTTGFGAPAAGATNTFGQNNSGTTGFGFGQNNQQQQPAAGTSGGLFGGGGFGATNNQPAQNTGTGLFGSTQQQPANTGGGLFGNTAAKPGGLFGNTAQPATGSTGFTFGQSPAQPAAPAAGATGGLFGSTNTAAPAAGGGLFGTQNNQQQAQQPAAGGLFANLGGANNTSSLFNKPAAPAATTGGLFGGGQQNQQPAQPAGGLFGGANNQAGGSGLFGGNNALGASNQQKPGGLFGGGGGLFGGQQNTQQPAQNTGGGLFSNLGGNTNTGGGLFGGQQQQQPAQPAGGMFGGGFGGALGQSTQQQQQQPNLTASIDQNPYGQSSLFQNTTGQRLDLSASTKKPALPPLASSSFRVTPNKGQLNKLRGFASPLLSSQSPSRASTPLNALSPPVRSSLLGSPGGSDRYKGLSDTALSPHAFVPRPSIKKLTVHPKGPVSGEDRLESVLGKSALRSSTGSPAPQQSGNGNGASTASPGTLLFNPPRAEADTPVRTVAERERPLSVSGSERPLKKGEYWSKPKMEKLKQMSQAELRSVSNFVVGCKGKGEVAFQQPVDLTGINLNDIFENIVIFGQMEMALYSNNVDNKPAPGKGLNQPARITLLGCFAIDKGSKRPVKDTQDPRHKRFVKKIKDVGTFVAYDEAEGIWVFEVDHFSRWGVPMDSDSDEDSDIASAHSQGGLHGVEAENDEDESDDEDDFVPTRGLREDSEPRDETDESESDSELSGEPTDLSSRSNRSVSDDGDNRHSITNHLGPDGVRKMRAMQSSFFGDRPAERSVGIDPYQEKQALVQLAKRTVQQQKGFEFAGGESGMFDDRAVKRASFGEAVESPKVACRPRKYARVSLEGSSVSGNEGVRVDGGLAMGRSFRCSWGPNGELVHMGRICKPSATFASAPEASIVIEPLQLLADTKQAEIGRAKRLLDFHLDNSEVQAVDEVPFALPNSAIRFGDLAKLFEGGDRSHEANLWRLGVALFDEIDLRLPRGSPENLADRISEVRRKLALSKWLEDAVAPSVDHDLVSAPANGPEKIFTFLSGNQIDRAVQAAIDGGDMRLATLISQIGGSEEFRAEMQRQLDEWSKYKVNPLISDGYRRLYALLAGIMDVSEGDASRGADGCKDVIISAGLDWKRAFGLRLWYGNPFEHTIVDVLAAYASDLEAQARIAPAKPLPAYIEKPGKLAKEWTMGTEPSDILYGLIKLYSDPALSLDDVLRARDCSASPLDARLQWHLALLLSWALKKRDFADRDGTAYSAVFDGITSAYAAQLEEVGEWTDSAFVLLHLQIAETRGQALKALIHRHPNPSTAERAFLLDYCQIPQTWLHEAKAAELAAKDDVYGEFKACLEAELFERAHRLLLSKLAIEAIVRGDHALLKRLCGMLEGNEPEGWEYGGKLFLDYLEINEDLVRVHTQVLRSGSMPDPQLVAQSSRMINNIPRLIKLLPGIFPDKDDPRQRAALSDMLSSLAGLEADLRGKEVRGVRGMVSGDRLAVLQQVAYTEFERSVGVLA